MEWKENFGELISTNHANRNYKLFKGELFPEKIFGQVDAVTEWEDDENLSSKLFVHTESYEVFKRRSNLFMFGRRGTGKTALINMLDYEINKGIVKSDYNYSKIIYQEETFYRLTLELRAFKDLYTVNELSHIVKEIFVWVIYTSAMIAVIEKNGSSVLSNKNLGKIKQYLENENFIRIEGQYITEFPFPKAIEIFSNYVEQISEDNGRLQTALIKTLKNLESIEYKSALNSLVGFLVESRESCLILIDSQELYELNDTTSECAISGLIDAVLKIFNQYPKYKILAKAAFPSEIVPHLKPSNLGKMNDKEHYFVFITRFFS